MNGWGKTTKPTTKKTLIKSQLEEAEVKLAKVTKSLEASKTSRNRQQRTIFALQEEKGMLEYRLRDATKQVDNYRASFNSVSTQRDKKSSQLIESEDRVRKLRNERDGLRKKLKRATAPPKLTAVQESLIEKAEEAFPPGLHQTVREIVSDRSMNESLLHLVDREDELKTYKMLMVGLGVNPAARRHLDDALDKFWGETTLGNVIAFQEAKDQVVVGSGVHAAIYAMVRFRKTGKKTVVIERNQRAGGAFAVSKSASFYLNSRNRPGPLSVPGDEYGALNVLPGSAFQPSDLGGGEYLTNTSLSFVVRMMLLQSARVVTGQAVTDIVPGGASSRVSYASGPFYWDRSIVATGLGEPRRAFDQSSDRYLTFNEFMAMMDSPFPLRGMARVAVLGAGDSGKAAIEALTGQGPSENLSSVGLDFVQKLDWYGVPEDRRTREQWEGCSRSRYKGIGRLLPRENGLSPYRVEPLGKASSVVAGYDCLRVDGLPYDYVIDCTGFFSDPPGITQVSSYFDQGREVGKSSRGTRNTLVAVGPASVIEPDDVERPIIGDIPENLTSIFRYADRTARTAEILG